MRIEVCKPNIMRIMYHQEQSDPHYGSCLWAYFDFDPDKGQLMVQSDCGFYHYRWPETGVAFAKLMMVVHADYLEDKLAHDYYPVKRERRAWIRRIAEIYEDDIQPAVREIWKSSVQEGKTDEV